MEYEGREDLSIDESNILEEWRVQAGLYMSYAQEAVDLQKEVNDKKDEIDRVSAAVDLQVRQGTYPLMPEGMKVTEKAVEALVATDPPLCEMKREYNELRRDADVAKKLEMAFAMRKSALENIVIIQGREYYSEPKDKTNNITEQQINKKLQEKFK